MKAIASDEGGKIVLKTGQVGKDDRIVDAANLKTFIAAAKIRQWVRESKLRMLA